MGAVDGCLACVIAHRKCDFDPAEVCTWPCGAPEDRLCKVALKGDAPLHPVELSNYHLAAKKTTMGDFNLYRSALGQPIVLSELSNRDDLAHLFDPLNAAPLERWQEAKDYCQWLGTLSGYPVDLPTEAQWEYAARSRGNKVLYSTHDGSLKLGKNYPYDEQHQTLTVRVDALPPNPLGLYMMAGGANEAVNDWYSEAYYRDSPVKDKAQPAAKGEWLGEPIYRKHLGFQPIQSCEEASCSNLVRTHWPTASAVRFKK